MTTFLTILIIWMSLGILGSLLSYLFFRLLIWRICKNLGGPTEETEDLIAELNSRASSSFLRDVLLGPISIIHLIIVAVKKKTP